MKKLTKQEIKILEDAKKELEWHGCETWTFGICIAISRACDNNDCNVEWTMNMINKIRPIFHDEESKGQSHSYWMMTSQEYRDASWAVLPKHKMQQLRDRRLTAIDFFIAMHT